PDYSDLVLIAKAAAMDYRTLIAEILAGGLKRLREKRREAGGVNGARARSFELPSGSGQVPSLSGQVMPALTPTNGAAASEPVPGHRPGRATMESQVTLSPPSPSEDTEAPPLAATRRRRGRSEKAVAR